MSRSAARSRLPRLLLLVLVVVLAGAAWFWLRPDDSPGTGEGAATQAAADEPYDGSLDGGGTVTDGAGTSETAAPEDDEDDGGAAPTATPPASSAAPRQVDVSTTYGEWDRPTAGVVVGGIVTGVIEAGGTCTVTLTRDGVAVQATSEGASDARSTTCSEIRVAGSELSSGEWEGVLTYRSAVAAGESASFTVVVP